MSCSSPSSRRAGCHPRKTRSAYCSSFEVVALCRENYKAATGRVDFTDDEAIGWACDSNSKFCGLLKLLDIEIRLVVEPFMLWEQGDLRPFVRALPSMCALIASGHTPKVGRPRLTNVDA